VPTNEPRLAESTSRYHQIDDAELDRIMTSISDRADYREERDVNLLAQPIGFQALDEIVVIDAAIGVFRIVRQRRRALEFQRRGCARR